MGLILVSFFGVVRDAEVQTVGHAAEMPNPSLQRPPLARDRSTIAARESDEHHAHRARMSHQRDS
jgi:hypothetical protein